MVYTEPWRDAFHGVWDRGRKKTARRHHTRAPQGADSQPSSHSTTTSSRCVWEQKALFILFIHSFIRLKWRRTFIAHAVTPIISFFRNTAPNPIVRLSVDGVVLSLSLYFYQTLVVALGLQSISISYMAPWMGQSNSFSRKCLLRSNAFLFESVDNQPWFFFPFFHFFYMTFGRSLVDLWSINVWSLVDLWSISGWSMVDLWLISGWSLVDLWLISGWSMVDQCLISGWSMVDLWLINGRSLVNQWLISGWSMVDLWLTFGWPLSDLWLNCTFKKYCFTGTRHPEWLRFAVIAWDWFIGWSSCALLLTWSGQWGVGLCQCNFCSETLMFFVYRYVFVWTKSYQDFDIAESSVVTKIKGVLNRDKNGTKEVWDAVDFVVPPQVN